MLKPLNKLFRTTLLGNLIYSISLFIIVIILTRSSKGNFDDLGSYTMALAFVAPIYMLTSLNMRLGIITDQGTKFEVSDFIILRLFAALIFLVISVALSAFLYPAYLPVIAILSIAKFFEMLNDLFNSLLMKEEGHSIAAVYKSVRGVLYSISFFCCYYFFNLYVAILSLGIVNFGVMIFQIKCLNLELNKDKYNIKYNKIKSLLMYFIPIALIGFLDSLNLSFTRYILGFYDLTSDVGIFSALIYFLQSGGLIMGALALSVLPKMSSLYLADNYTDFNSVFKWLLIRTGLISLLVNLVCYFFSEQILLAVYGINFVKYSHELFLVSIAATLWYFSGAIGTAINAMQKFNHQLLCFLIMFVGTAAYSMFNLDYIGLSWAIESTIFGMFVRLIFSLVTLFFLKLAWRKYEKNAQR